MLKRVFSVFLKGSCRVIILKYLCTRYMATVNSLVLKIVHVKWLRSVIVLNFHLSSKTWAVSRVSFSYFSSSYLIWWYNHLFNMYSTHIHTSIQHVFYAHKYIYSTCILRTYTHLFNLYSTHIHTSIQHLFFAHTHIYSTCILHTYTHLFNMYSTHIHTSILVWIYDHKVCLFGYK